MIAEAFLVPPLWPVGWPGFSITAQPPPPGRPGAPKRKINTVIRTRLSPRHGPDEILAVPAIPRTLSDKKMEVPVKKLIIGVPIDKAANVGQHAVPRPCSTSPNWRAPTVGC